MNKESQSKNIYEDINYVINKKKINDFQNYLDNEISGMYELIKEFPEREEYAKGCIEAYSRVSENFNALRFYSMKPELKNNKQSLFQKLIKTIRGDSYFSKNNCCR